MKQFKGLFLILTIGLLVQLKIEAVDAVITFFIKEKITNKKKHTNHTTKFISISLEQPSFINAVSKDRSWLYQPGVDGIQASYLGYITTSDKNGQITFPRVQQSDTLYILVTPEIEPEFMIKPTLINNWITKYNRPKALYEISRKKHKGLETYYFDVKRLAVTEEIPPNTIIIFAHPNHIHVPVGISLNTYSTNFILPELQAEKVDTAKNSLYTLSIKQYFEQINIDNKKDVSNIATMVVNL
ncbi:MAG: hypothetical protein Q8Q60_02545 [Candidatus Chromulinivorax sp.]|nr:hypothetical protein [Candidatus Chromulinivorax sp.]